MAILVTGGTGFIGSRLIFFLRERGKDVILFNGDISKVEDVENFQPVQKVEALIHLAAAVNSKDKNVFQRVNVEGTKNIVELGRRLRINRFIFLSSIRVLSSSSDPYIDSKKEAEKIVVNSGLPYVILRPSLVYGPGDKKNISFLLKLAKIMPMMPVLNFRIQPIFIDDLVQVIYACLKAPVNQTINVVGPEVLGFKDILETIKKQSKRKFLFINCPRFFSRLLRALVCLPFFPLPPWQVQTLLANEIYEDNDRQKLLGIKATPFVEGLRKTLI